MLTLELEQASEGANGSSDRLLKITERYGEIALDIQALSHELHSSKLEYLGLVAGLRTFCQEFSEQQSVDVEFTHENVPSQIPPEVSLCLFRVAQEAVYGDSRSMMYLPYKQDEEPQARQLMVDMFELVLPVKVAPEVVEKDVKLIYDPSTKELVEMVMPFDTASEVTTLKFDKGWVTEASVEDIKLLPGVSRTMFRLEGGDWVAKEVVANIK